MSGWTQKDIDTYFRGTATCRVDACVDACKGLEDPVRDVAEMRRLLAEAHDCLDPLGQGPAEELLPRIRALLDRIGGVA